MSDSWSVLGILSTTACIEFPQSPKGFPYVSLQRIIELLSRKPTPNGFRLKYDNADELHEAFWGAIPKWKQWNRSEATQVRPLHEGLAAKAGDLIGLVQGSYRVQKR
ncbi:hypothetical protein F5Y13DRAFT_164231 [Hypoxylon sp. FL1857]|nr:hypothetical protein F5Y13DRAFT_164231 [Hypoxylon sp. FL1857]